MANEKGLTCLLMVGATATSPATYARCEGQTSTSFNASANVADTTDKDNNGWQTGMSTTRSGTITCSGNLKTPRPNFALLETAWSTGATHGCSVVLDSTGKGWRGDYYVTDLSISGDTDGPTTYSLTLTPAAALSANPVV